MRRTLYILISLVFLLSGAMTSCSPAATPPAPAAVPSPTQTTTTARPSAPTMPDEYIIGVTADLTGPLAASQGHMAKVFKLYFDEVNKKGGVNGHTVKVILDNYNSDPAKTTGQVQSYIDGKACMVYSMASAPTCEAAITMCSAANMPIVTTTGMTEASAPHPNPVVFNLQQSADSDMGEGLGYATIVVARGHQMRGIRVASIALDEPSSKTKADRAADVCKEWDIEVDRDEIPLTMTDYQPLATAIVTGDYDIVLVTADETRTTGLLTALQGFGYAGYYITPAISAPDIMLNQFKLPNRYYIVDSALRLDVPQDALAAAKAAGMITSTFTTQGWSMGQSVESILKQASWPPTTEKMLAVMNQFTHNRIPYIGPIKWTADDHTGKAYRQVYTWTKANGVIKYGPAYKIDARSLMATENPAELNP